MKKRLSRILCAGLAGALLLSATPMNAYALTSKDVYNTLEAESLRCTEGVDVVTEGNITYLAGFDKDDYLNDTFDISKGVDAIEITYRADKASFLTISMDNFSGPKLASLRIDATNGQFVTKKYSISSFNDNKAHDLYFKCNLGQMDIDSFKFISKSYEEETASVNPYEVNALNKTITDDEYTVIKDVDFSDGIGKLYIYGNTPDTYAIVEVYLDGGKDEGTCIAGFCLRQSDEVLEYTQTIMEKITGKHDLYFICTNNNGKVNLDSWKTINVKETNISRDPFTTVQMEDNNLVHGTQTVNENDATLIKLGTPESRVFTYRYNFNRVVNQIELTYRADSTASVEIRLDGADGDIVKLLLLNPTNGKLVTKKYTFDKPISGSHFLVFHSKKNSVYFDSWKAVMPEINAEPIVRNGSAYDLNEAEYTHHHDDCEVKTEGDITYLAMEKQDTFNDRFDFDKGYKAIEITYRADKKASLTGRIFQSTGPAFAYLELAPTNGKFVTKTFEIPYPQDQNTYDLTFTCGKNNIDIDSFKFIPADEEEKVVTINPYELNEINKTISKDNSTVVENVDFSDGIDKFSIYGYTTDTYGIVQIYLDAPNSTEGTSIGGFSFEKGEVAKEYSQIHRLNISGVHNIYFVCTNDNANINLTAWKADKNFTHEIGNDPYKVVPITDYESLYASETITDSDTTFIALTDEKSRIFTYHYDCSNGLEGIRLTYKTDAPASIKVLDGAFNGESLGTIKLPGTNGKIETKLFRFNKIITGSHSLTFVGDVNTAYIASWQGVDPQTFVFPGPKKPVEEEPVAEEPIAETKGNTVECAVNSWGSGCSASLTVKNESDTTTDGWTIKIKKADFTIDACWCVNMEETDDYYIFTPLDWNKTLSAGQSLQFGFNASGNIPESIEYTLE